MSDHNNHATPNFDITVLGSSGGPLEGITSSFLVKPASLSYSHILNERLTDAILAVDSGAGLGKLAEIISDELHGCPGRVTETALRQYVHPLDVDSFTAKTQQRTSTLCFTKYPLNQKSCQLKNIEHENCSPVEIAFQLSELIQSYLITHAHMDHIGALVINSPAFGHDSGKHIYGLQSTVDALQEFVFNDHIWPNLSSRKNGAFLDFVPLEPALSHVLSTRYSVVPYKIHHGCTSDGSNYHSTAYLFQDSTSDARLLIFGDVEADSHSHSNANITIWKSVSPFIANKSLQTIIIECSTANLPPHEPLFGHLTSDTLFSELLALNKILQEEINYEQGLQGVTILITHVKERRSKENPRIRILNELNALNEQHQLGCIFTMLLPGQTYSVL